MRQRKRASPLAETSSVAGNARPHAAFPAGNRMRASLLGAGALSDPRQAHERQAERLARGDAPLGAALRDARLHNGPAAALAARAADARAFTLGRDIVFGAGHYAPSTTAGRLLLRHELVHVLQQDPQRAAALGMEEPLERAAHAVLQRNGPLGPVGEAVPEDPEVAAFKALVSSVAKQRLRMSSASLSLWSAYLAGGLSVTKFEAQALASVAQDLFTTARSTWSESLYEQWTTTGNPAMREVKENQMHGRWRACTGCHATIQADNWGKTQPQTGPEWEPPLERMRRLAGLEGQPFSPQVLDTHGLSEQEASVWPSTVGMLGAVERIEPALQQLGPTGYRVLPEDAFSRLSGLKPEELLAEVESRIEGRRQDFADLIARIDEGDIDALLFLPVVDALLSAASAEVRAAVTAEIDARRLRERAEGYVLGGAGLLALLLTIFPPTAMLGLAIGAGVSAANLGQGLETLGKGTAIQEGRGSGVFSDLQGQQADEMVAGGLFTALMSAVDLVGVGRAAVAARGGGRTTALVLEEAAAPVPRGSPSALEPESTLVQGPITVTASADGALFATHAADPSVFVVVQHGVAKGYRFRNGTFELVGTRRFGPGARPDADDLDSVSPLLDPEPAPLSPVLAAPETPFLPSADLVWVNTGSGAFHRPDSSWYGTTKQGQYMTEADALAEGHREAGDPFTGIRKHAMITQAQRPFEGQTFDGGWTLAAVERTVGGAKRVDELWINHTTQKILVVDTYTGPDEPLPHYLKGWAYAREADIQKLRDLGYHYDYQVGYHHPSKLH